MDLKSWRDQNPNKITLQTVMMHAYILFPPFLGHFSRYCKQLGLWTSALQDCLCNVVCKNLRDLPTYKCFACSWWTEQKQSFGGSPESLENVSKTTKNKSEYLWYQKCFQNALKNVHIDML